MTRRHMSEALLRAMREELERRTLEEAERIFGGPLASGPRPSFGERDFGKWADKVRPGPGPDGWMHFELPPEFLTESPPCEPFAEGFRWTHQNDPRTRGAHYAWRSPSRSDSASFKESHKERPDVFQYPGGEMFTTRRPKRSLFLTRAYLAVSEEPGVAVAAVGYRGALAAEELAVKRAPSGIETHSDAAVAAVVAAEAKLRRRIRAALIATTPSAEPELW
jgi:hypothetical protein